MQLNVRLLRIRTECALDAAYQNVVDGGWRRSSNIVTVDKSAEDGGGAFDVILRRKIQFSVRDADGLFATEAVDSFERFSVRLYELKRDFVLAVINPPRGTRYIESLLGVFFGEDNFHYDSVDVTEDLVRRHVERLGIAKLVSAKIRDFPIYDGAVARLEVSSRKGIKPGIAPFLKDKFYKFDSATYEITDRFSSFLITYNGSGSLKISDQFIEPVLSKFVRLI